MAWRITLTVLFTCACANLARATPPPPPPPQPPEPALGQSQRELEDQCFGGGWPDLGFKACDVLIQTNAETGKRLALTYKSRGAREVDWRRFDTGPADLDEAIKRDPDNADAYYERGRAWVLQGDDQHARPDFDQALSLNPIQAAALRARGELRYRWGQFDLAAHDFDRLVALNPRDPEAYFSRAAALCSNGEVQRALVDFTSATQVGQPSMPRAKLGHAVALLRGQDYKAAVAEFNANIQNDGLASYALYGRGLAEMKLGQIDLGRADLAFVRGWFAPDRKPLEGFCHLGEAGAP